MVRNSKQGIKKSPPGRGRGSRKPKPTGVVPITKYFPRSPKSTPLVTEAAGASSHSNTQLSPPLKELPKPPLSDSSNHSLNGYSESTTGEKTSKQPLKVSPKKIKLGDVRVVLRKSPIKRENKVVTCSEAKPQAETPRNNIINISDSPAELSGSLSIDAPEPKRPCLIDLTESPLTITMENNQQRSKTQMLDKAICSKSSVKGGGDINEGMKEPLQATGSTTQNTNCTVRTALFTDCDIQCTNTTPKDDLASITSPSLSSQRNDKVEGTSSSLETTQTLTDFQAGEKTIHPTEDGTSQPLNLCTSGEKPVHQHTGEGDIQPQTLNPLEPLAASTEASGYSTKPASSSAADSATVLTGGRGVNNLDISDVQLVLCQRGASYFQGDSCAVKLFSVTQNSVLDNLLDFNSRIQSQKLSSIVQYLWVATTAETMPRAYSLTKLWELITDPITSSKASNFSVLDEIEGWLHQLLLLHPPGQHHAVDQQYALFFNSIPSSATGAVFRLWEHIMDLLSGSEYCIKFLSVLVDLLLADYWAFLDSHRKTPPLFFGIFWQSCEQTHLTVSLRKLLEVITLLLLDYTGSKKESVKLENLMALIYLASTRCRDLTMELLLIAQKLPTDKLLLFFSRVQPLSLASHIAENVPELKEMFAQFSGLFCPNKNGVARNLFKPSLVTHNTTKSCISQISGQTICVDNEEETTECTPSIRFQSQPSSNPQNLLESIQDKQDTICQVSQLIKGAGLRAQFNGMPVERSSTENLPSQEQGGRKQGTPSIMNTNRRQPASKLFVVGGTSKPRVVAQVLYHCENCRNGTCPRCIQARSIPINSYCKE